MIGRFPVIFSQSFSALGHIIPSLPRTGQIMDFMEIYLNNIRKYFQSLESISTMQVDPSNLKSLSFNRRGTQPQTFSCFSGPRRPLQCLVSKFLNFYKLSRPMIWWSRPIPHVEAFGPSGCSHVDDKVAMVDHTSGCHQIIGINLIYCHWFLVNIFLLTIIGITIDKTSHEWKMRAYICITFSVLDDIINNYKYYNWMCSLSFE